MDYSKILQELEEASLFDLFRLTVAINDEIKNPQRIKKLNDYHLVDGSRLVLLVFQKSSIQSTIKSLLVNVLFI